MNGLIRALARRSPSTELVLFGPARPVLSLLRQASAPSSGMPWPANVRWATSFLYPLVMGYPLPGLPRAIAVERALAWFGSFTAPTTPCPEPAAPHSSSRCTTWRCCAAGAGHLRPAPADRARAPIGSRRAPGHRRLRVHEARSVCSARRPRREDSRRRAGLRRALSAAAARNGAGANRRALRLGRPLPPARRHPGAAQEPGASGASLCAPATRATRRAVARARRAARLGRGGAASRHRRGGDGGVRSPHRTRSTRLSRRSLRGRRALRLPVPLRGFGVPSSRRWPAGCRPWPPARERCQSWPGTRRISSTRSTRRAWARRCSPSSPTRRGEASCATEVCGEPPASPGIDARETLAVYEEALAEN